MRDVAPLTGTEPEDVVVPLVCRNMQSDMYVQTETVIVENNKTITEPELVHEHDLLRMIGVVNGVPARIFVDPGATHDIISDHFAMKAGIDTKESQTKYMTIKGYDGILKKLPRKKTTKSVQLEIGTFIDQRRFLVANTDQDIILGKPWLTRHNPQVDWQENEITIGDHTIKAVEGSQKGEITIDTISAAQIKRLVRKHPNTIQTYIIQVKAVDEPMETDAIDMTSHLSQQQRDQLETILKQFDTDVFSEPSGLPPHRTADHRIEIIPGNTPPSRTPYRLSQPELAELRKQLIKLLEQGWIRPSISPFGAPILFVKKKNGDLRMCVDYRALNKITIKNKYPLPNISELLDRLTGAQYFTSLDLRSGYHQLRIAEQDIFKTAFNTRYGHYEYTVMPFGLTNAPASFQALMNDIFRPYLDKFVIVYLDDILIYSATWEKHMQHLDTVLSTLSRHQLHCAVEKCKFAQTEIDYLGYLVSSNGIKTNPNKTNAVTDWPTPTSTADVQTFMGFANWFHKHIPKFADIAVPLTDLLRGDKTDKEFQMNPAAYTAFEELKQRIAQTPVLALPDFQKPFRVTTDASDFAAGMMLSQVDDQGQEHPIAFESRKFKDHERNWAIPDKELAAVVHALTIWRHYLDGQTTTVFTDHQALKYIQQQQKLNQRQARWLDLLQGYDLDIQHMPGRLNRVADALSRRPDLAVNIQNIVASTATIPDHFKEDIRQAYEKDDYFLPKFKAVQQQSDPALQAKYAITGGLLYLVDNNNRRLCVPDIPQLKLRILQENHDTPNAGHFGFEKTYGTVARYYWWPNMAKYIKNFVSSCDYCQRVKSSNQPPVGLLLPIAIPQERWEVISMDFITGLPKTQVGNDMIMTIVDKLSKRAHFLPAHMIDDARDIANIFIKEVFRHHGLPKTIVSDRDSKFTSSFWKYLMERLGTQMAMSTANHPQTDGQTERMNRTLEDMLRCVVNFDQNNWDELLPLVEFAYNNQINTATHETPFYVDTGRHPRLPQDILIDPGRVQTVNETANQFAERMTGIIMITRDILQQTQDRQAQYFNTGRRQVQYNVGDQVLVDLPSLMTPEERARSKDKLRFRRVGPYPIMEKLGPNTYRLELPRTIRAHNVFNITALTPYRRNDIPDRVPVVLPPVMVNGQQEWQVAKILAHRNVGRGRQYLTVWQGERDIDATWQPRRDFMDEGQVTTQAVLNYERQHGLS